MYVVIAVVAVVVVVVVVVVVFVVFVFGGMHLGCWMVVHVLERVCEGNID